LWGFAVAAQPVSGMPMITLLVAVFGLGIDARRLVVVGALGLSILAISLSPNKSL